MSLQKVLNTLKTVKKSHRPNLSLNPTPYQEITQIISKTQNPSSPSKPKPLKLNTTTTTFLSNLNPTTLFHVLTDPDLKSSKCLRFFNFLLHNPSLLSFKPDLQAHLTLICRLARERRFSDAEKMIKFVLDWKSQVPIFCFCCYSWELLQMMKKL